MQQPLPQWPASLVGVIGRRIAHYRTRRGLTAQGLAEQLQQQLGVPMKRTVIGDIETGVRKGITVPEVLAIAAVLDVPPVMLITPLGDDASVEVLPGVRLDTWAAARWITGEGQPPSGPVSDLWRRNTELLDLYRQHTETVARWDEARPSAVVDVADHGDTANAGAEVTRLLNLQLARRKELVSQLRLIRRSLTDQGAPLPALPAGLARSVEDAYVRHQRALGVLGASKDERDAERAAADLAAARIEIHREDGELPPVPEEALIAMRTAMTGWGFHEEPMGTIAALRPNDDGGAP